MHAYRTDMYEGMLAETIAFPGHEGDMLSAYLARPLGPGPHPGVVLIHHLPGWDEWYREATRRFAYHGYAAICPNLYQREGHGTPGGVSDDQVVGDVAGAARYLRALPSQNGRVGVFGTCSGGRHAYLAACRTEEFDAVVDCWGGRVVMTEEELTPKQPVAPLDYTASLSSPLLGLFGEEDRSPPPAQVQLHEEELKRHGKDYEFHMYAGAGHGFFYHDRGAYRVEQAMDGWGKLFEFLGRHLA